MSISSERLSDMMNAKNISVRLMAEETGISKSSVSNYMNGLRDMPLDCVEKMAAVLDVSACWIIGWTDDPKYACKEEEPAPKSEPEREEFGKLFTSLNHENRKLALDMMRVLLARQLQPDAPQE